MTPPVENLVLVEMGAELVAEADFFEYRISVRCIFDTNSLWWVYHVFLVDEKGLMRISPFPSYLRTSSRMSAVQMGINFGVNHIMSLEQPLLMLVPELEMRAAVSRDLYR